MKRHINIPIFIPHLGCPNQCVFCNQRTITGVKEFDIASVKSEIDEALETVGVDTEAEIAFFGGSFTGIGEEPMTSLLKLAYSYVQTGRVKSIRCSTRPDYIDDRILDILWQYGVRCIELGLQSSDEQVLMLTRRGHTCLDEKRACELIVKRGFTLVGQMMIGLPGSDLSSEIKTARFICECGAKGARIYPTVVFYGTELQAMASAGEYTPLTLLDAVKRSAAVLRVFLENGVKVIRIGLCATESLTSEDSYYAGPNHAAIGELVEGEVYYELINEKIRDMNIADKISGRITVTVPSGALSKAIGQNKRNKIRLENEYPNLRISFTECKGAGEYQISIRQERNVKCT